MHVLDLIMNDSFKKNRWDDFLFHADFNLINHGFQFHTSQHSNFSFRKSKNVMLCQKAQSTMTILSLSLSPSVYNEQHLSDAKKAQQSLEGTYKQLDNVSFSL